MKKRYVLILSFQQSHLFIYQYHLCKKVSKCTLSIGKCLQGSQQPNARKREPKLKEVEVGEGSSFDAVRELDFSTKVESIIIMSTKKEFS